MLFKREGRDGNWKGNKSGTSRSFSAFSSKGVAGDSSVFVRAIRDGHVQNDHLSILKALITSKIIR